MMEMQCAYCAEMKPIYKFLGLSVLDRDKIFDDCTDCRKKGIRDVRFSGLDNSPHEVGAPEPPRMEAPPPVWHDAGSPSVGNIEFFDKDGNRIAWYRRYGGPVPRIGETVIVPEYLEPGEDEVTSPRQMIVNKVTHMFCYRNGSNHYHGAVVCLHDDENSGVSLWGGQ